jgi:predicted nucleotidyltransferase component of viral defense system
MQKQRLALMREIAKTTAAEDAILKGGTGLLLCYGLDRFSEDMDFDGYGRFDFERVQKLIAKAFEKQNTNVTQAIVKKDTPTTKRVMFHYEVIGSPRYAYPLKIEFSFRQSQEIADKDFTVIDGIKTYTIERLAEKKLNAFFDRTAPRDIYDVSFLLENYPKVFTLKMLRDIIRMDMNGLAASFEASKLDDALLSAVDGDALVCGLFENAAAQKKILQGESDSEM